MCFDYDEYATLYRESVVVTRKPHRCACCARAIPVSEQCRSASWIFEGRFGWHYVCNLCVQDQYTIVRHEIEEGCRWHESWPSIEDIADYMSEHELPRATEQRDITQLRADLEAWHVEQSPQKQKEMAST